MGKRAWARFPDSDWPFESPVVFSSSSSSDSSVSGSSRGLERIEENGLRFFDGLGFFAKLVCSSGISFSSSANSWRMGSWRGEAR